MEFARIPGTALFANDEARTYYERGAEGDATALYNFAVCLETGQVVELSQYPTQNPRALWVCRVSSWRLGSQGVGQDAAEAARWYGKAAEAGSVDALFNLGVCYETGNGVPVSLVEAVKLYSRAAAKVRPPVQ